MNDYKKEAEKIIENNIYMTIATASLSGEPWISPVFFAYDNAYNLYWVSDKNSRHSKLIRGNNRVAIVIFDSNSPEGDGDGVYFESLASELSDRNDIEKAMELLGNRVTQDEFRIKKIEEVTEDGVWRIYKATPKRSSKLTEGGFVNGQYIDKRIDIDLT